MGIKEEGSRKRKREGQVRDKEKVEAGGERAERTEGGRREGHRQRKVKEINDIVKDRKRQKRKLCN